MESSGHARWFERLLRELQFELWIGDAQLLLQLLLENRFPRIWVPDAANRDLRQLLWHRHRLVQMRTRVMNQLQAVALNEGLLRKKRLWREHELSNWKRFGWLPGPADAGRICWSCCID